MIKLRGFIFASTYAGHRLRRHWRVFTTLGVSVIFAAGGFLPSIASASSSGGVSSLPASLRPLYNGLDAAQPVGATYLANFKSKTKPPWTIGYSSEYASNNWRAAAIKQLFGTLLPEYKKAGLVKKVIVDQSNLNNELQIQQIEQMVNQGVNAIITCCAATTVLNGAIAYAHARGVPFFVFNGYVTSPYAINESGNYVLAGEAMATALFKQMGGKGEILNVVGFPGIASNDSVEAGLSLAMKKYPGIKIAGSVTSLDTDPTAKQVTLSFLSSHPGKINGVFTQSPGETGVLQAFLQSGRPVPSMTIGGESGPMCYWRTHKSWAASLYNIWPPGNDFAAIWQIMMRTLEGQGPKIQSMLHQATPETFAQANAQTSPGCSTNGNVLTQPSMNNYFSGSLMNSYFLHPANPLTYKG